MVIGEQTLIGAGVKIIGDSHGPVRIGSRVQILENTVLHLLPDNTLVIDDDAVIGPGAMIHGCHIGRGSIVEPGVIVCDGSVTGAESVVRAGACVKQRDRFGDRSILDGFPARLVGTLTGPPPLPGWALPPDAGRNPPQGTPMIAIRRGWRAWGGGKLTVSGPDRRLPGVSVAARP